MKSILQIYTVIIDKPTKTTRRAGLLWLQKERLCEGRIYGAYGNNYSGTFWLPEKMKNSQDAIPLLTSQIQSKKDL